MAETAPFELTLKDGSVVKAESVDEAIKMVAKMKEDTSAALRTERESREQIQAQLTQLQQDIAKSKQPAREEGAFDRERYYRLVSEDPIAAQNYVDAARFGIADPSQVPHYFQQMQVSLSKLEQETLAASFVNTHPDFPPNLESGGTLAAEVARLRDAGHPVNMDTMDLAWRNCVARETIKPIEAADPADEPNPSLGGSGAGSASAEETRVEAEVMSGKMSMPDFEKYLRSKGMLT